MSTTVKRKWVRPAVRIACVVLTAITLGGCVIAPAGYGFYRPYHRHYYYY